MNHAINDRIAVMVEEDKVPLRDRAARVATVRAEAAAELASVIKAMEAGGLTEAGFRVGRRKDLPGIDWDARPDSVTRERLALARDYVRSQITLITAPDAVLEYQQDFIALLGDPETGARGSYSGQWDLW